MASNGVASRKMTDRLLDSIEEVVQHCQIIGRSPRFIAEKVLAVIDHDLRSGAALPTSTWVWDQIYEDIAGKPGTPYLHPALKPYPGHSGGSQGSTPPPASGSVPASSTAVPRGSCVKCKKPYENCSCKFGLPNGK